MGKLVVLRLDGEPENLGLRVTLEIGEDGSRPSIEMTGYLPPAPELTNHLQNHWLQHYRGIGAPYRIKPKRIVYEGSINECKKSAQKLRDRLTAWLNAEEFRDIDRRLREELTRDETIRFLIRTEDYRLKKLPWHLWDFFERYPKAEVALSAPTFERPKKLTPASHTGTIKVLAILGHNEGIDIEKDRHLLENLPHTETTFLVEKTRKEINDQLWEQSWDIIFFAGHSETQGETGRIYINPTESLTINELWYALRKAVERGLKLAIFNSCDGLGLAQQLNDLQIPQMIVMRELVPDRVAQEFLKYFLTAFASGQSLYLAVREARERLQGLEGKFPCASWLPVICQNLAQVPPTWEELYKLPEASTDFSKPILHQRRWHHLQTVVLASIVVTSLVIGVRSLGLLQFWELRAFDQLMQHRPDEGLDKRLLLVTITEKDVQSQPLKERGAASLSDRALAQLLKKLEHYQARAIGLDIYRENPAGANYPDLASRMGQSERFIAICKYGNPGVSPPPEVPGERQGFNNVLLDSDDTLRRHLLAVGSSSPCQSKYSFNMQLATRYLANEKIELKITPEEYLQLGTTVFKTLEKDTAGYHNLDSRSHQILLNYRASRQIAETLTLADILSEGFNPDLVKNRIVLIGTTAPSFNDHRWHTPYSWNQGSVQTMTGLEIQAHMISQILSAVLDGRPLIGWWSKPGEALWIWCWSLVGGLLAWRFQLTGRLVLWEGTALGILYGSCLGLLILKGSWIPLVPSALALVVTGGSVAVYTLSQRKYWLG